ncbi:autotransporter domain-containing protein [Mesorhizobium sp. B2-4-6]|uniref:autotransporter domain-containing protein n=1 Tax=Mesorhizobium sp. B2-4-6 TaxID=2589943 RepID=UPI001FEF3FF9|nr:autotransporter domain-containing protein [Mesorhizobium sp. B2-4-6]
MAVSPAFADDWNGSASANWFTVGNWSGGVPTGADSVYIDTVTPNAPVIGSAGAQAAGLSVGYSGTGTLTIQNGGTVTNTFGIIGYGPVSKGTATVDGAGSSWTNSGDLFVGYSGDGTLTVKNGGKVSNNFGSIGGNSGSIGAVTVDGPGSSWTSSGNLYVGYSGDGTLTVKNGGAVSDVQSAIGYFSGSTGAVTVEGADSSWTNSGFLYVGNSGIGTLTVTNGGGVSSAAGYIGYGFGSVGTVTVDGAGSSWSSSSSLFVGVYGKGTLMVSSGGKVSNSIGYIGYGAGSTGNMVTVDGSTWTNSGDLFVGYSGDGDLMIQNGGKVSNSVGYIGFYSSSTGAVTVDGVNSSWTNSGDLAIGYLGAGTLTIQGGGKVSNAFGYIGANSGSGAVTVDGANSSWTNSGNLYVGQSGAGTLTVKNGGKVSNADGYIGAESGSTGTVTVDGPGSSWTNSTALFVGYSGTGTLTVTSGGTVSNTYGYIGANSGANFGSTGTVMVTGAGSSWTNSGDLYVGTFGAGSLTIQNGGMVSAGSVFVASAAASTGTINIGSGIGDAATAPGILAAADLQFFQGSGSLVFNHTGANYGFATNLSGGGTVRQMAGFTNLTGNSNGFTGATTVEGGTLAVNGVLGGTLDVLAAGRLQGTGTVGNTTVAGTIAPGNSIGTLNVAGNITFNAGSTYEVEVNAAGQADRIDATGTAAINGSTVQVLNAPGVYALGSHYTILTAADGVSGTFAGMTQSSPFSTPFLSFGLSYDPNAVYLDVSRSSVTFASAGLTPNQIATGGGLDSAPPSSSLVAAIAQLDALSVRSALDQLSGEVHASAKTALAEDSRFARDAVNDRLRAAFDAVGAVNIPVMGYADGEPMLAPATTDRFAVWGSGFGSWGHTGGDGNAARLKRSTGGFFVGGDGLVFDTWRLGAVAGYSRTDFTLRDRGSSGTSDNYHLGLYGGTQWGNLAFRTGAAYTWHSISTDRTVAFPGFTDSLTGDYNAGTAQVFGELGYGMRAGDIGFEPFANLAYVNLHTDGFTEKGGAAALTSAAATTDATLTTLGLRASSGFMLGAVSATAKGTLGWRHTFGDVTPLSTMAFAGGTPFSVTGVSIARDAAVVEAGLDFAVTPSATVGVSYHGQFASGVSDQSVRADFSMKF